MKLLILFFLFTQFLLSNDKINMENMENIISKMKMNIEKQENEKTIDETIYNFDLFKKYKLNTEKSTIINDNDKILDCSKILFKYDNSSCYLKKETIKFLKKDFYIALSFYHDKLLQVNLISDKTTDKLNDKYFKYFNNKFIFFNYNYENKVLNFVNIDKFLLDNKKFVESKNKILSMTFIDNEQIKFNNQKFNEIIKNPYTKRIITFKEVKNKNKFIYSFEFLNPNSFKVILKENKRIEKIKKSKFKDIEEDF